MGCNNSIEDGTVATQRHANIPDGVALSSDHENHNSNIIRNNTTTVGEEVGVAVVPHPLRVNHQQQHSSSFGSEVEVEDLNNDSVDLAAEASAEGSYPAVTSVGGGGGALVGGRAAGAGSITNTTGRYKFGGAVLTPPGSSWSVAASTACASAPTPGAAAASAVTKDGSPHIHHGNEGGSGGDSSGRSGTESLRSGPDGSPIPNLAVSMGDSASRDVSPGGIGVSGSLKWSLTLTNPSIGSRSRSTHSVTNSSSQNSNKQSMMEKSSPSSMLGSPSLGSAAAPLPSLKQVNNSLGSLSSGGKNSSGDSHLSAAAAARADGGEQSSGGSLSPPCISLQGSEAPSGLFRQSQLHDCPSASYQQPPVGGASGSPQNQQQRSTSPGGRLRQAPGSSAQQQQQQPSLSAASAQDSNYSSSFHPEPFPSTPSGGTELGEGEGPLGESASYSGSKLARYEASSSSAGTVGTKVFGGSRSQASTDIDLAAWSSNQDPYSMSRTVIQPLHQSSPQQNISDAAPPAEAAVGQEGGSGPGVTRLDHRPSDQSGSGMAVSNGSISGTSTGSFLNASHRTGATGVSASSKNNTEVLSLHPVESVAGESTTEPPEAHWWKDYVEEEQGGGDTATEKFQYDTVELNEHFQEPSEDLVNGVQQWTTSTVNRHAGEGKSSSASRRARKEKPK